jgi:hypothetical protein
MTNSINAPIGSGFPGKTDGRVSMISMLAISVGMAAVPAYAQDVTAPPTTAPVAAPAPTILSPQPAPASTPTTASPPESSPAVAKADATPPATTNRANDLARKGGFDAQTVAPEALAQIESEQQARKAAAAKAATASANQSMKAPVSTASGSSNNAATSRTERAAIAREPMSYPVAGSSAVPATNAIVPVAAIPSVPAAAPETAAATEAAVGSDTDWGLLAALAALLGVGGAGAYAVGRRRNSKGQADARIHGRDSVPASMNEAIMPELRRDLVAADVHSTVGADKAKVQPIESKVITKVAFADFVANLPELDEPHCKVEHGATIGERRVAAAPRPYLGEADLSRPEGYFMTNVSSIPTSQNPFLTRQKRLKRARLLDRKLTEMKASVSKARRKMDRQMESQRPLEPAFS